MDITTIAGADADVVKTISTRVGHPAARNDDSRRAICPRWGRSRSSQSSQMEGVVQNAFFSNVPGVSAIQPVLALPVQRHLPSAAADTAREVVRCSCPPSWNRHHDLADNTKLSLGANVTGIFVSGARAMGKRSSLELFAS